jgi:hypothetical protein
MTPFCQLIDLTSGNIVGDYDAEAEALGDLRQAGGTHGWNSIGDYTLMSVENEPQSVIAMQRALMHLVRRSEPMTTANVFKSVA